MLSYYGGFWNEWENPHKVTFDGENRLIIINPGVVEIDIKEDVYSDWKEWVAYYSGENAKFVPAMRSIGGDPISPEKALGSTFFLLNGWKIKPWDGHTNISIRGNIYTDDGSRPITSDNNGNESVSMYVSSLIETMIIDNTIAFDTEAPTWESGIGITNAYQNGSLINISWATAVDISPVLYKVYISDIEIEMFTEASFLGTYKSNAISISTEADTVSALRDTLYYIGVQAVDDYGNQTKNTNTLNVAFQGAEAAGVLSTEQHTQLMSLTNYDDTALFARLDTLGLTTEQHDQLMGLVNYDDKALRNLAYAILGA